MAFVARKCWLIVISRDNYSTVLREVPLSPTTSYTSPLTVALINNTVEKVQIAVEDSPLLKHTIASRLVLRKNSLKVIFVRFAIVQRVRLISKRSEI